MWFCPGPVIPFRKSAVDPAEIVWRFLWVGFFVVKKVGLEIPRTLAFTVPGFLPALPVSVV
jgi:hypothetical protein